MSEPIFILGAPGSGASVVAKVLHDVCGVAVAEPTPPTIDRPLGSYEAHGVVAAHRELLAQMERDWTCPPNDFRPDALDLTMLEEQVVAHQRLPGVWAMKEPSSMFLLPAWAHLGVDRVRLVAVARQPADTIRSIETRHGIRQDRADAIVDTYLRRLAEIAGAVRLPVVWFSDDGAEVLRQVHGLATALDLGWDDVAAASCFDASVVHHQSPHPGSSPAFDALAAKAMVPSADELPSVELGSIRSASHPEWPLETHLGERYASQRHELWNTAEFSTVPEPVVAEFVREGAQRLDVRHPGVRELHTIEVATALQLGAALIDRPIRPHGVLVHGLMAGCPVDDVEFGLRSLYVATHPFAELAIDVPSPEGPAIAPVDPPPTDQPTPETVREIALRCGWDHVTTSRLSPGRVGMVFRKRVLTDSELVPVTTDLISSVELIRSVEERLGTVEHRITESTSIQHERRRADAAERDLRRLRGRRSVRLALAAARPFGPVIRTVRAWKQRR